ncbi:MAG: M56 family metallopeptidase [Terracidiphilus sp.]|nr:M56 family metallopeptidase [Terracidiphilus sp.]
MNTLAAWLAASLLNALWQTALIFCAAWIAARLARPAGVRAEHRVWVAALLLESALPFCRFHPELWWHRLLAAFAGAETGSVSVRMSAVAVQGETRSWLPGWAQTALAALFVLAIVAAALRLAWKLRQTRQLLHRAEPIAPTGELEQVLQSSAAELGVDLARVRVALAEDLHGPATVGIQRPTLLLPANLIENTNLIKGNEPGAVQSAAQNQEAREELATALAHELVHIRRRDFAWNLFYEAVSLAIAWHPLLILTRGQLNESRELATDAEAAGLLNGNRTYARSLVRIAARMAAHPAPRSLAAMGIYDTNIFERRIVNLMRKSTRVSLLRRTAVAAGCTLLALAASYTAMALQADVKPVVEVKNGVATLSPAQAVDNLISKVAPKYPADAKKARIEGTVVLNAIIGTDGHMKELHVISGPAPLAQAAMEAVQQWVYRPYLLNGKPVQVETTINVIYTLGDTPPAQAAPVAAVSAGGQKTTPHLDAPPTLIYSPNPLYPPEASAAHQEGIVLVKTKIGADGHPTVLGVSGPEVFQKSAREAVEKYIFQPVTENGQPVETTITIEVTFKLYGNAPKAEGGSIATPGPKS